MIRRPCVADQFYPGDPQALKDMVEGLIMEKRREEAIGALSPHAGYIYSGKVAGSVFSSIHIPDDVILLGPNHTGLGERAAIYSKGMWETPLGGVKINEDLARTILEEVPIIREDTLAHLREHSLEVQLPFLQFFNPSLEIVPITFMHIDLERSLEIGKALGRILKGYGKKVLVVISSDMNHYESHEVTKMKDMDAVEEMLRLNPEGLWGVVRDRGISMCGVIPAIIGLQACIDMGAREARLVKYMTSGDVSGDYGHVVGYAGILIR